MKNTCPICGSQTVENSQYCKLHHRGHLNLESAFIRWKLAYADEIDKKAFLERVQQLSETGAKARDLAAFLLRNGLP